MKPNQAQDLNDNQDATTTTTTTAITHDLVSDATGARSNEGSSTNTQVVETPDVNTTTPIPINQQQQQYNDNVDGNSPSKNHITKDDPKPAVFIARKLFSDFVLLVNRKVEAILAQEVRDKPIYKSLHRNVDPIYDEILEALGAISEFCLPSLLKASIVWYHHQLGVDDSHSIQQKKFASLTSPSSAPAPDNQQQQQSSFGEIPDCGSPCNDTITSNSSLLRSPTPSSPEASNQFSIISTLPLDYQSPQSLTVIGDLSTTVTAAHQSSTSAANTSTSTATNVSSQSIGGEESSTNTIRRLELAKTRNLLIEFTFCQLLIEMFGQLNLHPGHEDLIGQIEEIAFEHFKYVESGNELSQSDLVNVNQLADKYAEMIGVLAQTRFKSVKKRFMSELNDLKAKEPTPHNIQCIVSLLSGFKYFRVKMAPIEDFEASFQFLQECGEYFLEVRHKSIRHALAGLFVEIMVPLASIVKNEVKIPCLKNFVETLWAQTLDMCNRKKHSITLFPLVTCLLCVSQRSIFLTNWPSFLQMCLSNLKNRDQKMCRVALESLYRLIWIYMIRVKCESNNVTQTRLQSIVDAIFPRGSRAVVPRDAPLNIFVDIIHFIAQERLDFAMRHIIFELLSVDRPFKVIIAPERMNVALQAFLVIVDSLQFKEGEPAMPKSVLDHYNNSNYATPADGNNNTSNNNLSSSNHNSTFTQSIGNNHLSHNMNGFSMRNGTSSRAGGWRAPLANGSSSSSNNNNNKMLNDDIAKSIAISPYFPHIQRSFNDILRALDTQYGRPLLLTTTQNANKEPDDMITGERKPKIELFKTCLTAIPRLMPEGMSKTDLIDLLARMTVHVDEDMRKNALNSLRILITEFADWRLDVIEGYVSFLVNQIDESLRLLQDNAYKMLLQLLISWRGAITLSGGGFGGSSMNGCDNSNRSSFMVSIQTGYEKISSRHGGTNGGQIAARKNRALQEMRLIQSELSNIRFDRLVSVIQKVEGPSLVMSCSCHQPTRRLAAQLLRECQSILKCYSHWTRLEQLSFKSPADDAYGIGNGGDDDDEDLSASDLRGSLSADNLSRITAASVANNNQVFSTSVTSMNIQAAASSSSVSKMAYNNSNNNNNNNNNSLRPHDPYDSDIEQDLVDCFENANQQLPELPPVFWVSLIMLESDNEQEYTFALRLLRRFLPNLPIEHAKFIDQVEQNLKQMQWHQFPGLHELVLRGCTSPINYDLTIALLDHMTPNLKHPLCNPAAANSSGKQDGSGGGSSANGQSRGEEIFPTHVIVLLTQLLSNYDDPSAFSLNIARRIAIWCDENGGQKLENLSAVMTLYSRRCFSKDAFQWTKCVVKYLFDAYPTTLHNVIPLLVDMLETGPEKVQRLVDPILYCILNYVDISAHNNYTSTGRVKHERNINSDLQRIYTKHLESANLQWWREAIQIFKLIISRSSHLATQSSIGSGGYAARELPGRTMDFSIDVESISVAAAAAVPVIPTNDNVGASATAAVVADELVESPTIDYDEGVGQNSFAPTGFNLTAATSLLIPKFINRKSLSSRGGGNDTSIGNSSNQPTTSSAAALSPSSNNTSNINNNKD